MKTIRIEINQIAAIAGNKMVKQYLVRELARGKTTQYTILESIEKLTEYINSKLK